MKKIIITIAIIASVLLIAEKTKLRIESAPPFIGFGAFEKKYIPIPAAKAPSGHVSYKGQNGLDALIILREKEKAWVEQDSSGMIISINNRKADSSKHEYWSFYVNGKMASVGAADYKTTDKDLIEWKIEKY